MTGFRQRAGAAMFQARRERCSGEASRNPRTSPPLEKCSPTARSTMTRTRLSASAASKATRNCSRWLIVMTLSGGRSRMMSSRCRAASASTRKPSSPPDFAEGRAAAAGAGGVVSGAGGAGFACRGAGSGSATRRADWGMGSLLCLAPPRRFAGADLAAVSGASVFMLAVDACSPRAAARGAPRSTEAPNRQRRPRPRPHWRCIQACSSNFLPRPPWRRAG